MAVVENPETAIMLVCRSGTRTGNLGNALISQLGFSNVSHLSDGMIGWMEQGMKTVPFKPE